VIKYTLQRQKQVPSKAQTIRTRGQYIYLPVDSKEQFSFSKAFKRYIGVSPGLFKMKKEAPPTPAGASRKTR
jgi:AraC-like DNA-binding protein